MDALRGAELGDAELAETIARIWPDFWLFYAERVPGAEVLRFDGATAVSFGFRLPLFNQVARTDPHISR